MKASVRRRTDLFVDVFPARLPYAMVLTSLVVVAMILFQAYLSGR